jgi:hypothetical protein
MRRSPPSNRRARDVGLERLAHGFPFQGLTFFGSQAQGERGRLPGSIIAGGGAEVSGEGIAVRKAHEDTLAFPLLRHWFKSGTRNRTGRRAPHF